MANASITVQYIDDQVARGLPVAAWSGFSDRASYPATIGDWKLNFVTVHSATNGYVIAVPSNGRTNKIFKKGRINWLVSLGFNVENAKVYFKASYKIKKSWDHRVAIFVMNQYGLDLFVIEDILNSTQPLKACIEHGIQDKVQTSNLLAALQILRNMYQIKGES